MTVVDFNGNFIETTQRILRENIYLDRLLKNLVHYLILFVITCDNTTCMETGL